MIALPMYLYERLRSGQERVNYLLTIEAAVLRFLVSSNEQSQPSADMQGEVWQYQDVENVQKSLVDATNFPSPELFVSVCNVLTRRQRREQVTDAFHRLLEQFQALEILRMTDDRRIAVDVERAKLLLRSKDDLILSLSTR
jgi:hypothetical protein